MRKQAIDWIRPDWPCPVGVRAVSTTRHGGTSLAPYASLNLGDHVGDDPGYVAKNRQLLEQRLLLPSEPVWLQQVHGRRVIEAGVDTDKRADAAWTMQAGSVCAVMTADCLPVLFCDRQGTRVAAVHAGWRGLAAGVLEATVDRLAARAEDLMAWMGPAIGPRAFEVGDDVRQVFVDHDPNAAAAFEPIGEGHWLADIYRLARQRLGSCGITRVFGGGFCTWSDRERFFSYRRDKVTGRMASLIWLQDD
jgi:YfiH family protein